MNTDTIAFEIMLNECFNIGSIQEMLFHDMKRIIVTVIDRTGYSSRYQLHEADELKNAPKNECLVFFMRDGSLYQGILKSIEDEDNMIVVKTLDNKFAFGLPLSGLLGYVWVSRTQIIKED